MTRGTRNGLILAAIHLAIVGSLGVKLLADRAMLPRAWVRAAPVDPNLPIRGRLRPDPSRDRPLREDGCGAERRPQADTARAPGVARRRAVRRGVRHRHRRVGIAGEGTRFRKWSTRAGRILHSGVGGRSVDSQTWRGTLGRGDDPSSGPATADSACRQEERHPDGAGAAVECRRQAARLLPRPRRSRDGFA